MEGFQVKGLVASVEEEGVFVDFYSSDEQKRAMGLVSNVYDSLYRA